MSDEKILTEEELVKFHPDSEIENILRKWDYEEYCGDECCLDCLVCVQDCDCENETESFWETKLYYQDDNLQTSINTIAVNEQGEPLIYELTNNRRAFVTEILHDIYIMYNDLLCDGVVDGYFKFSDFDIEMVAIRKKTAKKTH